jgi:hypothetical protein
MASSASSFASRLLKSGRNKAARFLRRNQDDREELYDEYHHQNGDHDADSGRSNPAIFVGTEMTEAAAAAGAARTSSRTSTAQSPPPPSDTGLVHYYVCMPAGGLEAVTEEQAELHTRRNELPHDDHGGDGGDDDENGSHTGGASASPSLGSHQTRERNIFAELRHFNRNRSWKKKVLALFIVGVSLLVFYDLLFLGNIRSWIESALDWMTLNPFGAVFSFIAFFVVATLLFVPPAILMFGAGYAFSRTTESFWCGFFTSSTVSFVGCVLGAIAAFLRSRYMMRDLIELFSRRYPIVKALDRALERKGFRVMLLLRLWYVLGWTVRMKLS